MIVWEGTGMYYDTPKREHFKLHTDYLFQSLPLRMRASGCSSSSISYSLEPYNSPPPPPICPDQCSNHNEAWCDGNTIKQCRWDSAGCWKIGGNTPCVYPQTCKNGQCVTEVCPGTPCTPGNKKCESNIVKECRKQDDGCTTYYNVEYCSDSGKTCENGYCTGQRCTIGWKCYNSDAKGYQNSDCSWSNVEYCDGGCSGGGCIEECENQCTYGQRQCYGTSGYKVCIIKIGDCYQWAYNDCPTGTKCVNGNCILQPKCTEGWACKDSYNKGYKNPDCTWSNVAYCDYGCENGACKPKKCTPETSCTNPYKQKTLNADCTVGYTDCPYGCENGVCLSKPLEKGWEYNDGVCSLDLGEPCSSYWDCSCSDEPPTENPGLNTKKTLILVHGFKRNENDMVDLQDQLSKDGYYTNNGVIKIDKLDCPGILRDANPVSFRVSYYDITTKNPTIDDLSTYLSTVIDSVISCGGGNKVDIVAHSMGGLVARNYIRMGDNQKKVGKLIVLGTPNHGVNGWKIDLGSILWEGQVDDMNNKSLFLEKLNAIDETIGNVQYYTIAGDLGDGNDHFSPFGRVPGEIKKESVSLKGAIFNAVVPCSHTDLRIPDNCGWGYNAVLRALQKIEVSESQTLITGAVTGTSSAGEQPPPPEPEAQPKKPTEPAPKKENVFAKIRTTFLGWFHGKA